MKKLFVLLATLFIFVFALALVQPAQALPVNPTSMNARFIHWQEEAAVIHILVWDDPGRPDYGPAFVNAGKPLLFGVEWGGVGSTLEGLLWSFIESPGSSTTVSVDGGEALDIKGSYQTPFMAATQSGPAWMWDHDADGPGDGDGDGVADWAGPVMFFRYQHPGLKPGTHIFLFTVIQQDPYVYLQETITVEVMP